MTACVKCGESKPPEKFPKSYHRLADGTRSQKRRPDCYACLALRIKTAPSQTSDGRRIRRYGSLPKGDRICGICKVTENLHVDHCHATGKVRGWLCSPCNTALGQFKDRPDLLRLAADYLERF